MPITIQKSKKEAKNLLKVLKSQAEALPSALPAHLSFLPKYISDMEAYVDTTLTGLDQLITAGSELDSLDKGELNTQMHDFIDKIRSTYSHKTGNAEPKWLKPAKYMKDVDYFSQVMRNIGLLESDYMKWYNQSFHPNLAEIIEVYKKWQKLEKANASDTDLTRRAAVLSDIRASLMGTLRLLNLSNFQITQARQSGVVKQDATTVV